MTLNLVQWLYACINQFLSWLISLGLTGKLAWIAQDWKQFVITIVLFGISIDVLVYVFRYRSYLGWRQLIERLHLGSKSSDASLPYRITKNISKVGTKKRRAVEGDRLSVSQNREIKIVDLAQTGEPSRSVRRMKSVEPDGIRTTSVSRQPATDIRKTLEVADRYQPAPPMESYGGDPETYEPRKKSIVIEENTD